VTHHFDGNQRYVPLTITGDSLPGPGGIGTLSVLAPTSSNRAPPGYYLLFLLNQANVPSSGVFVKLQ